VKSGRLVVRATAYCTDALNIFSSGTAVVILWRYPFTGRGQALRAVGVLASQNFQTVGTWRWQGCQPCIPSGFTPPEDNLGRIWVDHRAIVWTEGLTQWKTPVTTSGIERVISGLVAQCLNYQHILVPQFSHVIPELWVVSMKLVVSRHSWIWSLEMVFRILENSWSFDLAGWCGSNCAVKRTANDMLPGDAVWLSLMCVCTYPLSFLFV
jgi:hypothetical protein